MISLNTTCHGLFLTARLTLISACSSGDGNSSSSITEEDTSEALSKGIYIDLFETGALVSDAITVSCTLSGGTETTCYSIEITGVPAAREVGPFCPPSIYSEADEGSNWFDGSGDVWQVVTVKLPVNRNLALSNRSKWVDSASCRHMARMAVNQMAQPMR